MIVHLLLAIVVSGPGAVGPDDPPAGWTTTAPRDEVRPAFRFEPSGGRGGRGAFVLESDAREGLHGAWAKDYPVVGGRTYAFRVFRKARGIAVPRRAAVARITWLDERGKKLPESRGVVANYLRDYK